MTQTNDLKKVAILYVDDEAQSLKYFRKAFEQDFDILTASDVDGALELLREKASRIGVVLTDQRMPGRKGTELLATLKRDHPGIVRLLTTAYSDMDSAIEAVNSGEIWRYVTKPWNILELRGTLIRAQEFFQLRRERDTLLREKLGVLQRLLVADRIRGVAILAASLSHYIRNSMSALQTFMDLIPTKLRAEINEADLRNPGYWEGMWNLAQSEGKRIINIIDSLAEAIIEPNNLFTDRIKPWDLVTASVERFKNSSGPESPKVALNTSGSLPEIKGNAGMLHKALPNLLSKLASVLSPDTVISIFGGLGKVGDLPAVVIRMVGQDADWMKLGAAELFTPFGGTSRQEAALNVSVLAAFFVVHHHGGEICVDKPPGEAGFKITLPLEPEKIRNRPTDWTFAERLLDCQLEP